MTEIEKIDMKDRRILYELDVNSRQSLGQIGKKVKLPKSVVHHRIHSLKKRGILKNSYALVNFTKLGFVQYKVYLKFKSITSIKEKEIIENLTKMKNIIWVVSCRGKWDVSITIIAKDIMKFDEILKDIINKYGKLILEKDITIVSYSPLYSRAYFVLDKQKKEFLYMEKLEYNELDKTEEEILRVIAENSRISVIKIMDKLKLTRDVISYRRKQIEKKGIILCYRSLINLEKIGYHLYKIIFRLQDFSKENETNLINYCKSNKNIVQYISLIGNWDAEIEVEIESEDELYNIIKELKETFVEMIKDYEVLHITEEHKLNFYPL